MSHPPQIDNNAIAITINIPTMKYMANPRQLNGLALTIEPPFFQSWEEYTAALARLDQAAQTLGMDVSCQISLHNVYSNAYGEKRDLTPAERKLFYYVQAGRPCASNTNVPADLATAAASPYTEDPYHLTSRIDLATAQNNSTPDASTPSSVPPWILWAGGAALALILVIAVTKN